MPPCPCPQCRKRYGPPPSWRTFWIFHIATYGTILAVAWLLSCDDRASLAPPCELPCWTHGKDHRNKGPCHDGIWRCKPDGSLSECEGQVGPEGEICDGIDNDCDGVVDGAWVLKNSEMVDAGCMGAGVCGQGSAVCQDGAWHCFYPDAYEAVESRCDGLDNDCDGLIDHIAYSGQYCYTGPIGTEANAPCHPGLLACVDGETACVNQIVPSPELCDGVDNDCNGAIDDNYSDGSWSYDIVIGMDSSGSMAWSINAVATALANYVQQFNSSRYRFAIVDISANTVTGPTGPVFVDTQFTDFASMQARLQMATANGGGAEGSVDGIYYVCDRTLNMLGLQWRPGSVGIYLEFTDEPAQNYTKPFVDQPDDVVDACLSHDVLPFVWGNFADMLKTIAEQSNGQYFTLTQDIALIEQQLNSIVVQLCTDQ